MADRLGQQLGNYRLVALLGTGGFADVYLGQHTRFNQQAAIKVLHTHLSGQEASSFQHEAETVATLAHPAIVRVFDFDVQDGVPFLVMDYAPNGSLRTRYPKGNQVPLPQIVSYLKQVTDALQYAHGQKFIHRDVKPENMLLGRREEVLLSDFGLAALAHSSASLSTQGTGGTLAYMAPEQIEGHPRPASDQYALGGVVYEWLCGSRPFEGSATEVMVQHLTMPPPPLHERVPTIPLEIEHVVLRTLAKDPKARFASVQEFASALEQAVQLDPFQPALFSRKQSASALTTPSIYATTPVPTNEPATPTGPNPPAEPPPELATPPSQVADDQLLPHQFIAPEPAVAQLPVDGPSFPHPLKPTRTVRQRAGKLSGITKGLLIGMMVLVIAAGVLSSVSLLTHFGMLGPHTGPSTLTPVHGGAWMDDYFFDPDSLIPNGSTVSSLYSALADQALYLPLFYGDAQGVKHPGAASEVPSIQNGGESADATTWTFHLRPHLMWSDGAPYDARDVDYTWKLWANPKFSADNTLGLNLITSADVSADHLSITFHLKRPFAPFLADLWVDGFMAPLPAHHFNSMAPQAIVKSPDNLNPKVVSGPFMMAESAPGDHYTLVRNHRYYRASEGLPYLDKVVFRIVNRDAILKDLQAGTITSAWLLDYNKEYQRLTNYTLTPTPTSSSFGGLFFNFHNQLLASHQEVRLAMAMAVDQHALINGPLHGFASPLCTDHGSAYHPGFDPNASCPIFDPASANKLLDDYGWVRGPDGVRVKEAQRLEFEYSTTNSPPRLAIEAIIQRNFKEIGIKLDIQNYSSFTFLGPFLNEGKASPPTGAVAGRYDIAKFENSFGYDPDDSSLLSCDQFPPKGQNVDFYCNRALDALYKQEQATADQGVRQQLFFQIHQIYLTEFPFIALFSQNILAMVRKGTHNYLPSPFVGETVNIWEWWCDKGKC